MIEICLSFVLDSDLFRSSNDLSSMFIFLSLYTSAIIIIIIIITAYYYFP